MADLSPDANEQTKQTTVRPPVEPSPKPRHRKVNGKKETGAKSRGHYATRARSVVLVRARVRTTNTDLGAEDDDLRQLDGVRAHRVEHVLQFVDHWDERLHSERERCDALPAAMPMPFCSRSLQIILTAEAKTGRSTIICGAVFEPCFFSLRFDKNI